MQNPYDKAMRMAINAAEQFVGNTAPNPPVGAIALDAQGKLLCGAGHAQAGSPHAEAKLLQTAKSLGLEKKIHSVVVTLEPCNHQGRTPPCTDALIKAKIKRVIIGSRDPNPKVKGGGVERLRKAGIEVIEGILREDCDFLLRSFSKHCRTGLPWLTVKTAFTREGSMIPPPGQKTFTSEESLRLAHELRKRADAIWTGSGTILKDNPLFTIRHVKDFPGKKRWLVISDRRGQVPADWKSAAIKRGFKLLTPVPDTLENILKALGEQNILEVLLEAGPTLSEAVLKSGLWDEHVVIKQGNAGEKDSVDIVLNDMK